LPENAHNPFDKKLNPTNIETVRIDTDLVVFSAGGRADDGLYYSLLKENAANEIYCAGDARSTASAWEAITSANEIARNI
jgi:2-enoate reductase